MRQINELLWRLTIITAALLSFVSATTAFADTPLTVAPGRAAGPVMVALGPDGNLWFTEQAGLKIGRVTTSGVITEFAIPGAQALTGITAGPDGNVWFTDELSGFVGSINTDGTNVRVFPLPPTSHHPQGITSGPDGNLWFVDEVQSGSLTSGFEIGKISVSGHVTEYQSHINAGFFSPYVYAPSQIVAGPDGNLWFTNAQLSAFGKNIVGKITTSGAFTIYNTNAVTNGITAGADGNLWVIQNANVAKISTAGVETDYPLTVNSGYNGIALGPDGNVWFTEDQTIGYVTPAGQVTQFPITNFYPEVWYTDSITAGPDGALWILGSVTSNIGRVSTDGQLTNVYALNFGSQVSVDTLGPDGAIWATQWIADQISRVDTNGSITTFPTPAGGRPLGITTGPDGNLWYVDAGRNTIAKMTTAGAITEYSVGQRNAGLWTIVRGSDGNLWFCEYTARYNSVGRITPDGVITTYPVPTPNAQPMYITPGPDGNLWFTEYLGQKVGKINPSSGQITEYPFPGTNKGLAAIVTGSDHNLWIMETTTYGAVAKFSTSGSLLAEYATQFETFLDIRAGSDGALWIPQYYPNGVVRISTSGVVSTIPLTTPNSLPNDLAFGADGKIYVAEYNAGALGRMSAIGGTGNTFQATHGSQFNGAVATFVDGTPSAQPGDFTAAIDWGDGNRGNGTVSGPAGGPFIVSGTHTYAAPGSYSVTVTLHDNVDNESYKGNPGIAQVH